MNVLDLFSGIGGFSLGLERAGMKTVAFCESNPFCQTILRRHWPDVPIHEDIRTLDATGIAADVVCGGFPCKQTSVAAAVHGRRSGLDGPDSSLYVEIFRIVCQVRPRWVLVENPSGISAWADEIDRHLADAGYRVSQSKFKASDFGAPHERERIIFIADRDGKGLEIARRSQPSEEVRFAWAAPPGDLWRKDQSGAWRMDDGLPDRMDRIRAIGNAILPQIPEMVGRAIMKSHTPHEL